jgi:hypothetical protein
LWSSLEKKEKDTMLTGDVELAQWYCSSMPGKSGNCGHLWHFGGEGVHRSARELARFGFTAWLEQRCREVAVCQSCSPGSTSGNGRGLALTRVRNKWRQVLGEKRS